MIQYRYDQNHNLTNLVYPGGKTVVYFYDSLNRLPNVTDWANRKTSYTYDLASRLTWPCPDLVDRYWNSLG